MAKLFSNKTDSESRTLVERSPVYYGWVVAFAGMLGVVISSPGLTYSISIFTEHFISDLAISRSMVSTLYTGATVAASLVLPLVGRQIDRRGSRAMVGVIAALLGAACIFMGTVQGPIALVIGFFALRLFGQGSMNMVSQNVINQWWVRKRGMIMGITGVLSSLLGMGGVPNLINWMIPIFDWRRTFNLIGFSILFFFGPLLYFLFRNQPEIYHLQPDGSDSALEAGENLYAVEGLEENWSVQEAMRTSAFWILAVGISSITMMMAGIFFHMVSIFNDAGFSATIAASVYVPISVTTALVTLGSGVIADRVPVRILLSIGLVIMSVSLVVTPRLESVEMAILLGILLGVTSGLNRTASSVVWADYFGRRDLGSIIGVTSMISVMGSALGPMPFGIARDVFGSYLPILTWAAGVPLILAVLSLFAGKPYHPGQNIST